MSHDKTTVTLRPHAASDLPEIARIAHEAFTAFHTKHAFPSDIPTLDMGKQLAGFFGNHPKIWGVVAESGGRVIGSNFLDERGEIVGVGPITVDPKAQSRGVGRMLMRAVIDRARQQNAPGVRLVQDAFNTTSMSLYTSLGFDPKEPLALVTGHCRDAASASGDVRKMTQADLPKCAELCKKVHDIDRVGELVDALQFSGPVVRERGGRIVAYMSSPNFWIPNHAVAETLDDMKALFLGASALTQAPLGMLIPIRNAELFRWLLSQGMRVMKPMTLMAMGKYHEPRGVFFPSVSF